MPRVCCYIAIYQDDSRDLLESLESKAKALGLGDVEFHKDILRCGVGKVRHIKPFRSRHYGHRLYLGLRSGDTIILPSYRRSFTAFRDFVNNLRRWVTAGVRVIVIDLGVDTADAFGRRWAATLLAIREAALVTHSEIGKRAIKATAAKPPQILGLVRRGSRGGRYLEVDPTLYELGVKCREWRAANWTADDIETHLWKNKIYRQFKYAPKALPVESLRDPTFARKWTAASILTLIRNIDKIDAGVLSGEYRLPRMWRPTSGPLADIPFRQQAFVGHRVGSPEQEVYWNKARAIGRKVRELRRERNLSQSKLAKMCDMTQSMVSELEQGDHSPTAATLAKVATAFGVPIKTFDLKPAVPV